MQKKLIILFGIPASGKSTWRANYIHERNKDHVSVGYTNKDEIRLYLKSEKGTKNVNENTVVNREDELIEHLLKDHDEVIIDNTNLNLKHLDRYQLHASIHDAVIEYKFMDDSWNVGLCHKRNLNRDAKVPVEVIENMAIDFVRAWWKLNHHIMPNEVLLPPINSECVVFDIDGTLAMNAANARGWYEWEKVGIDTVIDHVAELVRFYNMRYRVILLSGRDAVCRQQTIDWLDKNFIPYDELHMRPEGSMESDVLVKRKLFEDNVYKKYHVVAMFDDRQQVCRLWRGLDLPIFQVGNRGVF